MDKVMVVGVDVGNDNTIDIVKVIQKRVTTNLFFYPTDCVSTIQGRFWARRGKQDACSVSTLSGHYHGHDRICNSQFDYDGEHGQWS